MTKRYFDLKEFFPAIIDNFPNLADYFLTIREESTLKNLNEVMKNFHEVTLMLQKKDLTLGQARVLFDGVISKYPTMNKYLAEDAQIVHFPHFERGYNYLFQMIILFSFLLKIFIILYY